jgi:hypothetical protein
MECLKCGLPLKSSIGKFLVVTNIMIYEVFLNIKRIVTELFLFV